MYECYNPILKLPGAPGGPGCQSHTVTLIHIKHGTNTVQGSAITIGTAGTLT